MCGIVGIVGRQPVNQSIYDALTVLQHRGQDAAGIATVEAGRVYQRKAVGLVRDVFRQEHMERLKGNVGLGHVRYPTAGCTGVAEAQPFYVNAPYGILLAHNGNLTNTEELRQRIEQDDLRHVNTRSDSEVLINILATELERMRKARLDADDLFDAIRRVHRRVRGAYAVIALLPRFGLVAFRDPNGIRPLALGTRSTVNGEEHILASESVAIDALGFQLVGDVAPGEAVFIDFDGRIERRQCAEPAVFSPCIFEHVYLARPDSVLDGISVYRTRMRMGEALGRKILRDRPDHDIDVVIPIPDTSRTAALEVAQAIGVPYREGFIKNRYIGRTFIMPGQAERKKSVRQKLNPIASEFAGRNVLLVDDSIVRGTTCEQIIQMAREAGAKKVYFASSAPPVIFPNVYGIDMPVSTELVAHGLTVAEIERRIGADWLVYQDLEDLIAAARAENPAIERFETSIFDGSYVTGDVDGAYLSLLESERSDEVKQTRRAASVESSLDAGE